MMSSLLFDDVIQQKWDVNLRWISSGFDLEKMTVKHKSRKKEKQRGMGIFNHKSSETRRKN